VSAVFLEQLNANSSNWDLIWPLVIAGVGQGLFTSPNTRAMMSADDDDEQFPVLPSRLSGRLWPPAQLAAVQEHLALYQAGGREIKQDARPLVAQPGPRVQPARQAEVLGLVGEVLVAPERRAAVAGARLRAGHDSATDCADKAR